MHVIFVKNILYTRMSIPETHCFVKQKEETTGSCAIMEPDCPGPGERMERARGTAGERHGT